MSFSNKVVLVTGASSGIGASIAILFSREGADVVMVGRNQSKLKNVADKCEQNGSKPLVISADLTKEEDTRSLIKETIDKFGRIDILINSAGITNFYSVIDESYLKIYDKVMNINLRAVVDLTHLAAPYLIKSKGNMVNISSILSDTAAEKKGIYSASKAALDHFTRCVALELAPHGVRANTVNPGPVVTDIFINSANMTPAESDKTWEEIAKLTALQRVSRPEEIADMVLFLASDKAKGITGSNYVVDNGLTLKI